jgi:hypothetical protein
MTRFTPHIQPVYPPHNELIFEEWVAQNYNGCGTDRELLPFFPTSYWVNNNYAQDRPAHDAAVVYFSQLDKSKKYFVICQYDDGCLIDFNSLGLDVLEFNMSKTNGVMLPLLCQPHPFKFTGGKKWFANFVGGKTHPIRETANTLFGESGYYISNDLHNIESYCRILHQSMFTLCYRGYGLNSFRIAEAMQYGSIPVYISDEFIIPFNLDFEEYGVIINAEDAGRINEILSAIEAEDVIKKQSKLEEIYQSHYTFDGALNQIIKHLEAEFDSRQ